MSQKNFVATLFTYRYINHLFKQYNLSCFLPLQFSLTRKVFHSHWLFLRKDLYLYIILLFSQCLQFLFHYKCLYTLWFCIIKPFFPQIKLLLSQVKSFPKIEYCCYDNWLLQYLETYEMFTSLDNIWRVR